MTTARRWLATSLVIALGLCAGAWWRLQREGHPSAVAAASDPTSIEPVAAKTNALGLPGAAPEVLVIGEYRPDTAGLPPISATLALQIPELRTAAAEGNATAACRLAEIGLQCAFHRQFSEPWPDDPAVQRSVEEEFNRSTVDADFGALPDSLRDYAQQRIEVDAMAYLDNAAVLRAWHRRCQGAPQLNASETLAVLRQAALAGEPRSMVRYAHADWMIYFIGAASVGGFSGKGPGMAWTRSPAFDQWRSEALSVRRAGLERGDPEMLQRAINPVLQQPLRPLGTPDPLEFASALRAHAILVTGRNPESTAALGLSPELAREADRLSEAWAARSRERGRSAEAALLHQHDSSEVPACD